MKIEGNFHTPKFVPASSSAQTKSKGRYDSSKSMGKNCEVCPPVQTPCSSGFCACVFLGTN